MVINEMLKEQSTLTSVEDLFNIPAFEDFTIAQYIRSHQDLFNPFPDISIVTGGTGTGKSTFFPLYVHLLTKRKVFVVEPRREATRKLAQFMRQFYGRIGYIVRFDNDADLLNDDIIYMTDGVMINILTRDPSILKGAVVMIDEFHERTINYDVSLSLLRKIGNTHDIKTVVVSATLEIERLEEYLGVEAISYPERMFPVTVIEDEGLSISTIVLNIVRDMIENDNPSTILIFRPGKAEINSTINDIKGTLASEYLFHESHYEIYPLHAELNDEDFQRVFEPVTRPRVVVSTNVAETSVTIPHVTVVIDDGKRKIMVYDAGTGLREMKVVSIAKQNAVQRKGRAGRQSPGTCYRLYKFDKLPDNITPQILLDDLSHVTLYLRSMGVKIEDLELLDKPSDEKIQETVLELQRLGALDEEGRITEVGKKMLKFPTSPRTARMLVELVTDDNLTAEKIHATVTIVALLSERIASKLRGIRIRMSGTHDERRIFNENDLIDHSGDLFTDYNVYKFATLDAVRLRGYDDKIKTDSNGNEKNGVNNKKPNGNGKTRITFPLVFRIVPDVGLLDQLGLSHSTYRYLHDLRRQLFYAVCSALGERDDVFQDLWQFSLKNALNYLRRLEEGQEGEHVSKTIEALERLHAGGMRLDSLVTLFMPHNLPDLTPELKKYVIKILMTAERTGEVIASWRSYKIRLDDSEVSFYPGRDSVVSIVLRSEDKVIIHSTFTPTNFIPRQDDDDIVLGFATRLTKIPREEDDHQ